MSSNQHFKYLNNLPMNKIKKYFIYESKIYISFYFYNQIYKFLRYIVKLILNN